jgi:hypothetical protein
VSTAALITMILVLGVVWGGFVLALRLALKKEKTKSRDNSAGQDPK